LTPKQKRFVAEYLTDLNAAQAAIRAGYKATTACEHVGIIGKHAENNFRVPHLRCRRPDT
jgi:hypothetical protein